MKKRVHSEAEARETGQQRSEGEKKGPGQGRAGKRGIPCGQE